MKIVEALLCKRPLKTESTDWGKINETYVKEWLSIQHDVEIRSFGLFIQPSHFYLGSISDGVIGEKGIVEIKCPFSARSMTPEEGINKRKITL